MADSAGTATAFMCGVKTRVGVLGVNQHVKRGDCLSEESNKVKSMLKYAIDDGRFLQSIPLYYIIYYVIYSHT